jgi:hypothetical protein
MSAQEDLTGAFVAADSDGALAAALAWIAGEPRIIRARCDSPTLLKGSLWTVPIHAELREAISL